MTGVPIVDIVAQQAARQVQILNDSLRIANESKHLSTRVSRLNLARQTLAELQALASQYTFLSLTNLQDVLTSIDEVAAEIRAAEEAAAQSPPRSRRLRRTSPELVAAGPLGALRLAELPVSVIDLETTGLSPSAGARIIEISIVRVDPGHQPRVVLETLINPQGPVYCTEIHGITDDDVVGAPLFSDVIGEVIGATEGTLVAAYNASFDMSFLRAEIEAAGAGKALRAPPPHVCLMWLRPLLGLGKRCALKAACEQHQIVPGDHRASADAVASARLWSHYVPAAARRGIHTLGDLAGAGSHKYLTSLRYPFYGADDVQDAGGRRPHLRLKPRLATATAVNGVREYWHSLVAALVDGRLDDLEVGGLRRVQAAYDLSPAEIRAVHARFYADKLREAAQDDALLDDEVEVLSTLRGQLALLGWTP